MGDYMFGSLKIPISTITMLTLYYLSAERDHTHADISRLKLHWKLLNLLSINKSEQHITTASP
jgi:hypothetical protein